MQLPVRRRPWVHTLGGAARRHGGPPADGPVLHGRRATLVATDAIVDKFVGDEVVGDFVPALAGDRHAARAIDAARRIVVATGNDGPDPWLPVGAGVNTGRAFIGTVGEAPRSS